MEVLKTALDVRREANPNVISVYGGDFTHGTVEGVMTVGDHIMEAMNLMGWDAATLGNWAWGYGAAVWRYRFLPGPAFIPPPPAYPKNHWVMACAYEPPADYPTHLLQYVHNNASASPAGRPIPQEMVDALQPETQSCSIIKTNFSMLANNIYNSATFPPIAAQEGGRGKRLLPAYKKIDRGGVAVCVIGVASSIVQQQAVAFGITFMHSQGIEELRQNIIDARADGCEFLAVVSELGTAGNIALARRYGADIKLVYSTHTHDLTEQALLVKPDGSEELLPNGVALTGAHRKALREGASIMVETSEHTFIGDMDLRLNGAHEIIDMSWKYEVMLPEDYPPDPTVKAIVDRVESQFVGPNARRHTFMPGGFCSDIDGTTPAANTPLDATCNVSEAGPEWWTKIGHQLDLSPTGNHNLNDVLATTDLILERFAYEGTDDLDMLFADAFLYGSREAINQTGMGRREALFYRTLADRVPMRVPRSYVARLDDASGAFALVIEDLDATACSLPDVGRGIRPEQALAAMRDFAALHVRYDDLAVREDEAGWVERMPRGTDFGPTMLQYGLDHHRDKLSDAFAEVAEFYIEHQAVLEDLWEQEPETVLQGDSHVGNLFEDAGHIGFLDWGLIQLGSPMRDVGYFITMALSPENRRKHERALIERYLEARSQHGGSALSFEDAWRLYRIHAAYAVPAACPLVMFPEGLTPEAELLATSFLDRSQQVVADLDVRAMLRDVAGI